MSEDDRLLDEVARAIAPAPSPVDPARIEALRAAVDERRRAATPVPDRTVEVRRPPRWLAAAAAAAAVVVAFSGGVLAGQGGSVAPTDGVVGETEYAGPLSGPAGTAEVRVVKTGIGRVIQLETDALPILPTGELYEVWMVSPDDEPGSPDRISAGTFHPDADGRSDVRFAVAADPAIYPVLSITAEPGDGDPRATGPEVLRARIG